MYLPRSLPNLHLRNSGLCLWTSPPPWATFTVSSLSQPSRYCAQASFHLWVALAMPLRIAQPEATHLPGLSCPSVPALHWLFLFALRAYEEAERLSLQPCLFLSHSGRLSQMCFRSRPSCTWSSTTLSLLQLTHLLGRQLWLNMPLPWPRNT